MDQSQMIGIRSDRIRISRSISGQRDVLPLFDISTTDSIAVDANAEIERSNEDDRPCHRRVDVGIVNIEIIIHNRDLNLLTESILMLQTNDVMHIGKNEEDRRTNAHAQGEAWTQTTPASDTKHPIQAEQGQHNRD